MRTPTTPFLKTLSLLFGALLMAPGVMAQCAGLQTPPVEQSFDNSTFPPNCWENQQGWQEGQVGDPGYGAGNATDHTGNGGYFAFVDFSDYSDARLASDTIDVSGMSNQPEVLYWFFSNNTDNPGDNNTLELEAWDGSSWQVVKSHSQDSSSWVRDTALLSSSYVFNDSVRIRFRALETTSGSGYYNDILIDDIQIRELPSCHETMNVTANALNGDSVELSWTGSGSEWQVEYGPQGFTPGNGDSTTLTSNPDTISGLSSGAAQAYDLYIRKVCGPTDSSAWTGPIGVTLPCSPPYSAVYASGFDITNTNTPYCWYSTHSDVEVVPETDGNYGPRSSPQMLELNDHGSNAAAVTPELAGLHDADKRISFYGKTESLGWDAEVIIGTMSDPTDPSTWVSYDTINHMDFPEGTGWGYSKIKFGDTASIPDSNDHIGIWNVADNGAYEFYIDDFRYEYIPASNVGIASISNPPSSTCPVDSAQISVMVRNYGSDPQSGFDVTYTLNGGTPVTETVNQTIQPYTQETFVFSPYEDLSTPGTYDVEAYTDLSGDTINGNDTASTQSLIQNGQLSHTIADTMTIPEDDSTVEDSVFVCGADEIYDCARILKLEIDSLHHEDAIDELDIQLVSPEGTTLNLWMQLGEFDDEEMSDLVFTDTAAENITNSQAPHTGAYRPQEAPGFSKFNGEQLNGMWRLRIFNDDFSTGDSAVLHAWNMEVIDPPKPQPDLGPDTTICQSQNLQLDPGNDPDWSYTWDDNSHDSSRVVAGSLLDTTAHDSGQNYTYHVTVTDTDILNQCSNSDTVKVNVESCVSIEERENGELSFKIRPNPASDRVFIQSNGMNEAFRYDLIDLQGRTIKSKSSEGAQRSSLDVSGLSKGVYLLKGYRQNNDERLFQKKLIVN